MPRILVVDDDENTRCTFRLGLKQAGYDVDVAESADVSYQLLQRRIPECILLDMKLGDGNGLDVLRWMRNRGILAPTAVVTGFRNLFESAEAMALGASAYVDKPLFLDEMLELVRRLMTESRCGASLGGLHARLLSGDRTALDLLARELLGTLSQRLQRAFPRAPHDTVIDSVEDAILEYAAAPGRFDHLRGTPLAQFVYVAAWRNLANHLHAETRRRAREAAYASSHMPPRASEPEPAPFLAERVRSYALSTAANEFEARAIEEWLAGRRTTSNLARALQLGNLPAAKQRREVKRFKDRILKRLTRRVQKERSCQSF